MKEAISKVSKLIEAVRSGEEVFLTNRGKRVAQLIPVANRGSIKTGRGCLKGKINFYPELGLRRGRPSDSEAV